MRAIGFTHAISGTSYVSFVVVKKLTIANKLEIDTFVTFASISGHIIAICGVSYAFKAIWCLQRSRDNDPIASTRGTRYVVLGTLCAMIAASLGVEIPLGLK